ncbi:NAD(P)/FAD-dependent oxidoreductase [Arcobacter sp. FWKO B]|uniref:NAD(P)/FAD-dependent oxidoreductase n=1 Tax=Arcobacter sp. FWKO B TaxID=2593672 RepID=UPI0018A39E22|nr:FAD/NAD(P)-binding oxidoreductase [Arcobacter sp. FWKO B]QOG11789.1 NAD(P)/FAD-dependent oxidoreductase [Arcobacter sp. FWKO B]
MSEILLKDLGISRREAFKRVATLGALSFGTHSSANATNTIKSTNAKIVIIGGGAGGISVAARLCRAIKQPNVTIIEPNDKHIYQAGQTLVGGGIIKASKLIVDEARLIPKDAKWIKSSAKKIDPDQNKIYLSNDEIVEYDYLVLAPGLQYDWEKIEGLSAHNLGKDGICSIFTLQGSSQTWEMIQSFSKTGGNGYFTHPSTPIKCGGAPKKILYLTDAHMRRKRTRNNAQLTFSPHSMNMFSLKEFDEAIYKQFDSRNIKYQMGHDLVKINPSKKEATYEFITQRQGEWDEDLEEYEIIKEAQHITKPYDFIHITPSMSAPDFLKDSKLIWDRGALADLKFINVDQYTLQNPNYTNVFGIGDAIGTPFGKTGGSVRKQAPVVVENLLSVIEGKEPTAKYNGYTVCPFITSYGTVMLAEFDYSGKPTPIIPLDPTQERWIWWMLKVYMLEPIYFYGMMKGVL